MSLDNTGRRPLLKALAGGTLALGAVATVSRVTRSGEDQDSPEIPALLLSANGESDVASLAIQLGEDMLPRVSNNRWASPDLPTSVHSMAAFTWRASGPHPVIQISSRVDGLWRGWKQSRVLHDMPDLDSGEGNGAIGTELLWIGDSDGIRVRVGGQRPRDLTLVLLHPAKRASDTSRRQLRPGPVGRITTSRVESGQQVARPEVLKRTAWGADESWRDGTPRYNDTIEQVHVHHTVNSNDYAKADVPALIRGMYRYHTQNLGWSDLAYNFLVDRFGRTWVGRAGGAARPVRGAHTLGFNATSTGIAVIGNYDLVIPTAQTLNAVARVAAWKLASYGRDPMGQAQVISEGSDRFPSRRPVQLPVIDGHRDTNDTACPGQRLYDALPKIRSLAKAVTDKGQQAQIAITEPSTVSSRPRPDRPLTVTPGAYAPPDSTASYTWLRDGTAIPGATGASYTPLASDVGTQLTVRIDITRPNYVATSELLTLDGLVKETPILTTRTTGRRSKAVVHIRVADQSGLPNSGKVTVSIGGRRQVVRLRAGRARVLFNGLARGLHQVDVVYAGTKSSRRRSAADTVRVR